MGVLDVISIDAKGSASSTAMIPKIVQYDPDSEPRVKADKMSYGAYRRWREAEDRNKKAKQKKKTNGMDSIMDTIRKLGSSPASTGGAGVGVMNPPSRGSDSSKGKSGLSPSGVSKKPA